MVSPAPYGVFVRPCLAIAFALFGCRLAGATETLRPGIVTVRSLAAGERVEYRIDDCSAAYLALEAREDGIDVALEWTTRPGETLGSDDVDIPRHGVHRLAAEIADCSAARLLVKAGAAPAGMLRLALTRFARDEPTRDARLALALRETAVAQAAGDASAASAWAELAAAWSTLGDWQRAAECEFRAGARAARANDRTAATDHYARAATAARRAGDDRLELWARNDSAMLAWRAGEGRGAGDALAAVARETERLDDPLMQATVLNNVCLTGRLHTDLQQARRCYERALALSRRSGDARRIGTALNNLGGAHLLLGEVAAARTLFEESLVLKHSAGDRVGEADSEFNLGWIAQSEGRLDDALPRLRRALETYVSAGAARGEARALGQIANLQELLGARVAALDSARRALAKLREVGGGNDEAFVLLALARLTPDDAERADLLARASTRADASGLMDARHQAHMARLQRLIDAGDAVGAAAALRDDAAAFATENPAWNAASELAKARIAVLRQDWDEARTRLVAARALAMRRLDPLLMSGILLATGEVAYAQRRDADADRALAQSIAVIEPLRTRILDPAARARFAASYREALRLRLDVLMRRARDEPGRGFDRSALLLADAERSRSLREAIVGDASPTGNRDEYARINKLALAAAQARANGDVRAQEEIRSRLAAIEGELTLAGLRLGNGASARGTPAVSDEARLRALREGAGVDGAVAFFAFGRDRAYAWRIDDEGVGSRSLGETAPLRELARRAARALRGDDDDVDARAPEELGALLFPKDSPLPQRIVIVPDDALRGVPFAALPIGAQRMLDLAEIEVAPSLSILQELAGRREERRGEGVLIVADPVLRDDDARLAAGDVRSPAGAARTGVGERLYASSREAGAIAELASRSMRVTRLEGFDATRERVLSALATRPRIVHFATHALVDRDAPDASGLVLSQRERDGSRTEGYLGLRDIAASRLPPSLVVLSACSTATGADFEHEGTWGLVQAFMLAGSSEVVASLWDVADDATAELMRAFYEGLFVEHLATTAALRRAQRQLRESTRYRSPRYWAAFFMSG